MIALSPYQQISRIQSIGALDVKQKSIWGIYGSETDFWTMFDGKTTPIVQVCRLSNSLTVCGSPESLSPELCEELSHFLDWTGGTVEGELTLMERLFRRSSMQYEFVMTSISYQEMVTPKGVTISLNDCLSPVHGLLCVSDANFAAVTPFESWLVDFSHRCRHGYSQCFILNVNEMLIGTISILFYGYGYAILGALAVEPAYRGHGYGILLLNHAAKYVLTRNLRPLLITNNPLLADTYRRYGWEKTGIIACTKG